MGSKVRFFIALILALALSIGGTGSAFASTEGFMSPDDFGYHEIQNIPDRISLTDEPITITDIEYLDYDGNLDTLEMFRVENIVLVNEGIIEVTENKGIDRYGDESTVSITITPKKTGLVQLRLEYVTDYVKNIYVYDPEMPAKKRDIPQDVKVTKYTPKSNTVSWDPVYGATEYRVFRSKTGEDGTFKKIKTTKNTSCLDTGLTSGKTYYYKVKAVTKDGVSNFSKMKKCRVARKLNIEIDMRNKVSKSTRFAKVQVTNYGKNTFKIVQEVEYVAGREFVFGASYYPYENASSSEAVMVNGDNAPLASYSFKKNTTAVVNFRLDNDRIPQKDAHIIFHATYDGVPYTIIGGDGYVMYKYGYTGCGVKYTNDTLYTL